MKLKTLGMFAGLAMLLPSAAALAHTDVYVDLGLRLPLPPAVVIEPEPAYYGYYPRTRVYYDDDYGYARRYYSPARVYAHSRWHDRGAHRGWREHERHEHRGRRHDDD